MDLGETQGAGLKHHDRTKNTEANQVTQSRIWSWVSGRKPKLGCSLGGIIGDQDDGKCWRLGRVNQAQTL